MSALGFSAAPEARRLHFWILLFGATAAPLFWLGQLMLGYGITSQACYPGDHPLRLADTGAMGSLLIAFDAVAILASLCGLAVAVLQLRGATAPPAKDISHVLPTRTGRDRFLAIWGVFSSLWFLAAILFNTIASLTVPLCLI